MGRKCTKDHEHQSLVGNRAKDAAFYPIPLVEAILKGIALQSAEASQIQSLVDQKEHQSNDGRAIAAMTQDVPAKDFGGPTYSSIRQTSGGTIPIV